MYRTIIAVIINLKLSIVENLFRLGGDDDRHRVSLPVEETWVVAVCRSEGDLDLRIHEVSREVSHDLQFGRDRVVGDALDGDLRVGEGEDGLEFLLRNEREHVQRWEYLEGYLELVLHPLPVQVDDRERDGAVVGADGEVGGVAGEVVLDLAVVGAAVVGDAQVVVAGQQGGD
jgi:hypothetical protein